MESAATPPPPPPPPADRTTATHPPDPGRAGVGARIAAVLLALVLAFITAVGVVAMIDIAELTPCEDVVSAADLNDEGECFDGSDTGKTLAMIFGWPGTILAGIATLLALGFAIRGRGGRPLLIAIIGAAVLLGLSILIG